MFRYLIITESYDVYGTDNEEDADNASDYYIVIDTKENITYIDGESQEEIKEWKA